MRVRHPLASFFALAYGISWLLWAPLWLPALGWVLVALVGPYALVAPGFVGASIFTADSVSLAGLGSSREFPQFSALRFLAYNIVSVATAKRWDAGIDVAFTSDSSSQFAINAAGALFAIWGITVVFAAGPAYLARRGKMVRLYGGGAVTGVVDRGAAP